jgi:hypothetical protein
LLLAFSDISGNTPLSSRSKLQVVKELDEMAQGVLGLYFAEVHHNPTTLKENAGTSKLDQVKAWMSSSLRATSPGRRPSVARSPSTTMSTSHNPTIQSLLVSALWPKLIQHEESHLSLYILISTKTLSSELPV